MRGKAQLDGQEIDRNAGPTFLQLWTKVHVHHSKLKSALAPPEYVCSQAN